MPPAAFQLNNVSKVFSSKDNTQPALSHICVDILSGQITGIIGRSGAGKSTLLRCLNALETPSTGQILFQDTPLSPSQPNSIRHARQHIGMIFQHFNLLSRRTVLDNVTLPLEINNTPQPERLQRAHQALQQVGMADKVNAYPNQLSGGQKQRVAIARALINQSQVLLCDEATSALDPETTHDILTLLQKLNRELNLTIVLITHEIQVIRDICHHVVVLDQGQIIESGPVESVFIQPTHPITQSMVQSVWHNQVPEGIWNRVQQSPIDGGQVMLRLGFAGELVDKAVIAELMNTHSIPVSILSGFVDHLGSTHYGALVVTLPYQTDSLHTAHNFFNQHHVSVETLGYLPSH